MMLGFIKAVLFCFANATLWGVVVWLLSIPVAISLIGGLVVGVASSLFAINRWCTIGA